MCREILVAHEKSSLILLLARLIDFNPLTTARSNILACPFLAINRQPLELESCSNPPWIQQVFELTSKKTFFVLGLRFSGGNVTSTGILCYFGIFAWPWALSQWAIFWTQSLVEN